MDHHCQGDPRIRDERAGDPCVASPLSHPPAFERPLCLVSVSDPPAFRRGHWPRPAAVAAPRPDPRHGLPIQDLDAPAISWRFPAPLLVEPPALVLRARRALAGELA